jgi:hypothetical protein
MLWEALRAEQPSGYRDCSIEVVRVKAGPDWDARLIANGGAAREDLARVFAQAKTRLQRQYGFRDD